MRRNALLIASLAAVPAAASAQYTAQRFDLEPGWNAIYLEIEPAAAHPEEIIALGSGRIESIWSYDNRHGGERAFEPQEFAQDIEVPPVRVKNRWHVYHPGHLEASNLLRLAGSRGYIVRVKSGAEPFTLELTGIATPIDPYWVPDDYSLTGFPIDPAFDPPTFSSWFAGSMVHLAAGSKIYSMSLSGEMVGPLEKGTARIESGRAYWIYTDGASRYSGPVGVDGVGRDGLDFGARIVEMALRLRNTTPDPREVTLRFQRTLAAVPEGAPAWAGDVPLQYYDAGEGEGRWVDIDPPGVKIPLDPESTRAVRLQAKRQGLPAALAVPDGKSYQGELQVTADVGARTRIVLRLQVSDPTGLWTGTASLRHVRKLQRPAPQFGQPGAFDPETGVPNDFPDTLNGNDAAPELAFPLILHVGDRNQDGNHELTLLRQVALLWKEGDDVVPGRYVLLTRKGLAAGLVQALGLVGGALVDGRRFSHLKTAPAFHRDTALSGPSGAFQGSGKWTASIVIPRNDPLNPFLHRYHPDHGHPKVMRETGGVPAAGGMNVERYLTLDFSATDPLAGTFEVDGEEVTVEPRAQYGDTIIGGTYREVILAPAYHPIVVQGSFELRRVVQGIAVLNDGQAID